MKKVPKARPTPTGPATGKLLFDPNAPVLAQTSAVDGMSVDDLIARFDPMAPKPEQKGVGESILRGAAQGVSLGFADEITGALESAFTDKSYKQARNESRAEYAKAQNDNPIAYGAGELGGGLATMFAPGLNAAKGASLATQAGKAALQGGLSGLGSSQADLTEGDVTGAAADTAIGAGLGAGLAAAIGGTIGRYVDKAPARVDKQVLDDLQGGSVVTKPIRDRIVDNGAEMTQILKDEGLAQHVGDAAVLKAKTAERMTALNSEIEGLTAKTREGVDVDANDVIGRLEKLKGTYKTDANQKKIQSVIDTIEERWVPEKPMDDRRLLQMLADGGKGTVKEKIAVQKDQALDVAKKFGLDKTVRNPALHKEATDDAVKTVGLRINQAYDEIDNALEGTAGMDLERLTKPLRALERRYASNPASKAEAAEVGRLVQNIEETWNPGNVGRDIDTPPLPATVQASKVREMITAIQSKGFGGSILDPSLAAALKRDIARTAKGALDEYLEDMGKLAEINGLNAEMSTLLSFQKAAAKRAASAELKNLPPPSVNKTGKMTAQELAELRDEVGASLPAKEQRFQAHIDTIKTGKPSRPKASVALRDELDDVLTATRHPDDSSKLRTLEKKRELLALVEQAATERARVAGGPQTRLGALLSGASKDAATQAAAGVGIATSLATGNPIPLAAAAAPVAVRALQAGGANLDRRAQAFLANLVLAAKKGKASAQMAEDAIRNGVPKAMVATALAGQRIANQGE